MFNYFFSTVVPFLDNVEKYCRAGQSTDDKACAFCMLDT